MPFPYSKILCPIAFDDNSADALAHAVSLAANSGAIVYLLHVLQINPVTAQGAMEGPAGQELYDAQVEAARAQLDELAATIPAGIGRELAVEIGEPGSLIVAAQQQLGVDLVVMATHGRRGLKHLILGSVAERVLRESNAPVLTLRGTKE
ncbi:MAG: universal stress protein [Deltaproteobacteria bacterium]|nr:universal stress protein [Deltaproteobacteria bacterium]